MSPFDFCASVMYVVATIYLIHAIYCMATNKDGKI